MHRVIKKSCKKKFLQRGVKTAIIESYNRGDFLKRLEQMYPVYKTDLSVRTEIEELPSLPNLPTAVRISDFVAQLEELMECMNPTFIGLQSLTFGSERRSLPRHGELQGDV